MKKIISLSVVILLAGSVALAQKDINPDAGREINFEIHTRYTRPIKMDKLTQAEFISDLIPGYPVNWITKYISVEISAFCQGEKRKALSSSGVLGTDQKNILKTTDLASDIDIKVNYMYKDPITKDIEYNTMRVRMTLVPETDAEFPGGSDNMKKYLKTEAERARMNIHLNNYTGTSRLNSPAEGGFLGPQSISGRIQPVSIRFTVGERGDITKSVISKSSGDPKTDALLIEVIKKMPAWKPAQNKNGVKVEQEFVFIAGGNNGC